MLKAVLFTFNLYLQSKPKLNRITYLLFDAKAVQMYEDRYYQLVAATTLHRIVLTEKNVFNLFKGKKYYSETM